MQRQARPLAARSEVSGRQGCDWVVSQADCRRAAPRRDLPVSLGGGEPRGGLPAQKLSLTRMGQIFNLRKVEEAEWWC